MLESSLGDISFFIHAPPSKDEGFLNMVAQSHLQRNRQNWTRQAFKSADKKFILQISFFKGHIQTKIEHSDCSHLYWWGVAGVQKSNKQTLENKEGLKAAALLLNISNYRKNDSIFSPATE